MRRLAGAVALVAALGVTAGCGGASPYCEQVEKDQKALDSFGEERTTAAFTADAKRFRALAKLAPESVADDWTRLADETERVLFAHQKSGLALEDADDPARLAELDDSAIERINGAYEKFNATTKERAAVVKNVASECDISLR